MSNALPPSLSTRRAMLALALPVLAEESLNLLVGYTDFFLAGRFLKGDEPLAAMGLIAYFMWLLPSMFAVVGIGALALVARLVGAGQRQETAHAARQALWLGLGVAVVVIALLAMLGGSFVHAMGLSGEAARLATRYIWIMLPAVPLVMIEQVGTACLRGAGDTVSGMAARIVLNLVDMTLSLVLVTGIGPFPHLGWEGLAIGSACGHSVGGMIILWRLIQGGGGLSLFDQSSNTSNRPSPPTPLPQGARGDWSRRYILRDHWSWLCTWDGAMMRRMLRVGLPGGIDVLSVLGCHLIYVSIVNSLGTLSQAAHGLGVQIEAMSYLPGSAFAVAAATLAGQSLGAADHRRAVRSVLQCAASAVAIMCVAGLVMFFAGEQIASIFTGGRHELTALVGRLLKIVALSCPPLAVLMVVSGALRGSGDTAWPLAITFIGLVGVRIPGACLLAWDEVPLPLVDMAIPGFGLGIAGAWWAMVADVALRSLLASARFLNGGWKSVKV